MDVAIPAAIVVASFFSASFLPTAAAGAAKTPLLVTALLVLLGNGLILPAFYGWTLGDKLLGLRLVGGDRPDSRGIGLLAAAARLLTALGLSPFFLLGYVWYFVDAKNRTWHDILAGIIVARADSPVGEPFANQSFLRLTAGLLFGAVGTFIFFSTVYLAVIFLIFAPGFNGVAAQKLPADFPSTVIIAAEENITNIVVTPDKEKNLNEVMVVWKDLPTDADSVLYAYKTAFDLFGYKTEIGRSGEIFGLRFTNPMTGVAGVMSAEPAKDGRQLLDLTLIVSYPSKAK